MGVGVTEALSRPSPQTKGLLALAKTWRASSTCDLPHLSPQRTARQLRPTEVDKLVAAYQAGLGMRELAVRFSISRSTVGQHLRARGVDTQPPGLHPDDIPAAVQLYRTGWSLARIADKFGTTDMTVRARLLEVGVRMRDPHERLRQGPAC